MARTVRVMYQGASEMSKSLKDAFQDKEESLASDARYYKQLKAAIKKTGLGKAFDHLIAVEPKCKLFVGTHAVYVDVPVLSMKHMSEVLEFLQVRLNIEFDSSQDYAGSGYRMFTSSNYDWRWLYVRAMVDQNDKDDAALCKRVITSYKTVEQPVYELECKDAAVVAE
jgi:hypothetical protein